MKDKMNEIIIFENQNVKLEVNMKDETVWLNLEQMTQLFNRDKSVISRHIKNVFLEEELDKSSVVAKFATTASDGKTDNLLKFRKKEILKDSGRISHKQAIEKANEEYEKFKIKQDMQYISSMDEMYNKYLKENEDN